MKARHNLDTGYVEDLLLATHEPIGEQACNIAKAALIYSGWSQNTTGVQLHRFCAGGLEACNIAAAKVIAGYEDLLLAGGVESMSRLGIGAAGAASGDPWVAMKSYGINQGLGADLVAHLQGFSRNDVDIYAAASSASRASMVPGKAPSTPGWSIACANRDIPWLPPANPAARLSARSCVPCCWRNRCTWKPRPC